MKTKKSQIFVLISILFLLISQIACKIEKIEESIPTISPTITQIPTVISTPTTIITKENNKLFGIVVDCEYLNIRTESNENSIIVTTIPEGERVEILEEFGGWYFINYNNIFGWVNGKYLNLETGH